MLWRTVGVVLATSANVMAQSSNAPNLPGFLSSIQSIASALSTSSSSSTSSTSSSSTSTSSSSSATVPATLTSSTSTPTAAASSSSTAASDASNAGAGIDARTRNIILGVTIPVGLILLALILALLFICCRRRRHRTRRAASPESKFAGNRDWEHNDNSHHGYNSNSSLRTGHSTGLGPNLPHDAAPLMGTTHSTGPAMAEHPAYRHNETNANAQNPFVPVPPISRKPVPNRSSTGSNISGISSHNRTSQHSGHHGGLATGAAAGAGVLAGAAAVHHHDKHRRSDASQNRPESWHQPLGSHPHDPSMYATAGLLASHPHNPLIHPTTNGPLTSHPHDSSIYSTTGPKGSFPHDPPMYTAVGPTHNEPLIQNQRRSSNPFSPDDVGSSHRSSDRYSQGYAEPIVASHQSPLLNNESAIIAPTVAQRRSLQSRNSSYSDGRDTPRGPSRSPKRRSLSGGGEMWQADPEVPPEMPTTNRYSNGDGRYTPRGPSRSPKRRSLTGGGDMWQAEVESPPVMPTSHRYSNGDGRSSNGIMSPALPSNRHLTRAQKSHNYDAGNVSNTDSSTSNDSWESAQAELNPWDDRDTGRYPRFSGNSTNSSVPLMPPTAAWDERKERRWSGDMFNRSNGDNFRPDLDGVRRNSGGNERRRLRFSEGQPEIYNEQGLVGRAL